MKRFLWLVLLTGLFGLSACNTVEGFGEDIQAVGDEMSDTARKEKNY